MTRTYMGRKKYMVSFTKVVNALRVDLERFVLRNLKSLIRIGLQHDWHMSIIHKIRRGNDRKNTVREIWFP